MSPTLSIEAEPYAFELVPGKCALLIIDMQRDFLEPGKGAFFATDLHAILQNFGIAQLIVTGVTTEVCVNTTVREANDRGYDCIVPSDCVASYFPVFQKMGLEMIKAQSGIFGWVSDSGKILSALD